MKRCAFAGAALTLAALALPLCLIRGTASAQDATGYGLPSGPIKGSCVIQCSKVLPNAKSKSTAFAATDAPTCSTSPKAQTDSQAPKALPVSPTVAELMAVLAETNSKGTYVATVVILGKMGSEARPALGAALRHGERLKVFEGVFGGESAKNRGAAIALQALATIAEGQSNQTVGSGSGSLGRSSPASAGGGYSGFMR